MTHKIDPNCNKIQEIGKLTKEIIELLKGIQCQALKLLKRNKL